MIYEIEEKISKWLPLVIENVQCDGPALHFYGGEWSFSAISAWRISLNNRLLVGSDESHDEQVLKILDGAVISQVVPQASNFAVDPVFYFDDGHKLEIFSDSSFDTWTFRIPDEPLYDFTLASAQLVESKKGGYFPEIQRLLPLKVEKILYESGCLILFGKDWSLTVPSSWRIIGKGNNFFGGAEQKGWDTVNELKNSTMIAVDCQSPEFPIDPVLFFSNSMRLELFTSTAQTAREFKLPSGKVISGSWQKLEGMSNTD